jgi:hypothetical protein
MAIDLESEARWDRRGPCKLPEREAPPTIRNRPPGRISLKAVLGLLAALVAPAVMLMFIHHYGVNAPFWDEWDELAIVPRAYDGTLTLAAFCAQQNEHRPITSKVASVVLAKTTQLNLVDEMYWGFAFEFLSLILIWRMLTASLRDRARVLIWPLTIVASLLLFWTVAFENWTWGIASFQYLSAVFWAVLAVWGLTSWPGRWKGTVIAAVSTALAIYTTGHGFALIPVAIVGMLAYGALARKILWGQLCLFAAVAVCCTALYLRGYVSPGFHQPGPLSRVRPLAVIQYFLTYLGSPFWTTRGGLALIFGVIGFGGLLATGYYIARFMRDGVVSAMPWLLLGAYTALNGMVTAVARLDFGGIEQANQPRYRSIVVPLWISLIVTSSIIAVHLGPRFNRATIAISVTASIILFIGGYSYLYYRGFLYIRLRSHILADGLPYLMHYETAPDDKLQIFHPNPATVRGMSRKLERYQLGPFAH